MSRPTIEEWLQRYYPTEACETQKSEALEHSIRKWEGLLHENLPESFEAPVEIDAETCALCYHYMEEDSEKFNGAAAQLGFDSNCEKCPLFKVRNGTRCDTEMEHETFSPYIQYLEDGDPMPMIAWLKKAREIK